MGGRWRTDGWVGRGPKQPQPQPTKKTRTKNTNQNKGAHRDNIKSKSKRKRHREQQQHNRRSNTSKRVDEEEEEEQTLAFSSLRLASSSLKTLLSAVVSCWWRMARRLRSSMNFFMLVELSSRRRRSRSCLLRNVLSDSRRLLSSMLWRAWLLFSWSDSLFLLFIHSPIKCHIYLFFFLFLFLFSLILFLLLFSLRFCFHQNEPLLWSFEFFKYRKVSDNAPWCNNKKKENTLKILGGRGCSGKTLSTTPAYYTRLNGNVIPYNSGHFFSNPDKALMFRLSTRSTRILYCFFLIKSDFHALISIIREMLRSTRICVYIRKIRFIELWKK